MSGQGTFRRTESFRNLAQVFGVSVYSLTRHRKNHINALLKQSREVREVLNKEAIFKEMNKLYVRMLKLSEATDYVLSDPDDPDRYVVGAPPRLFAECRASQVQIHYDVIVNGRPVKRKASLDVLLDALERSGPKENPLLVTASHYRSEDVLRSAREAARVFAVSPVLFQGSRSPSGVRNRQ